MKHPRQHPLRDRQHPAGQAQQAGRPERRHGAGEVRVHEPGRLDQGPDGAAHHREGRARGPAQAGRHHRGEHLRQHRHGRGAGGGGEGLPLHLHDAGQDVDGEDQPAQGARAPRWWSRRPTSPPRIPRSYYETAKRIARETPGSFYLNQYHNPDNIEAHYLTTGPEIWEQTEGKLDYFVAGLGTGGTMSGAGKYLKEKKQRPVKNVGVDPMGSVYQGYFKTGKLPPAARLQGRGHRRGHAVQGDGLQGARRRAPGGRPAVLHRGAAAGARGGHLRRRLLGRGGARGGRAGQGGRQGQDHRRRAARHRLVSYISQVLFGRVDARQRLPRRTRARARCGTSSPTADGEVHRRQEGRPHRRRSSRR